jgi:hypothetical protein
LHRIGRDPNSSEIEIATAKLISYKLPDSDSIPTELIQAGGEILRSEILELINSDWNEEKLPEQWKESTNVPIYKKGAKTNSMRILHNYSTFLVTESQAFLESMNS